MSLYPSRRIAWLVWPLVMAAVLACTLAPSAASAKASSPGIYVPSAIVVSSDGTVLWAKKPNSPRRVASTTKMLTALVVRERADLNKVITITQKAADVDGGDVGLRAGQKLTVRQLLGVMLVHSANGAAEALAIGIGGSEKKFVKLMNQKAASLGLKHTHPADPHGLSPKGVSTAADLAVISRELMADPVLRSIVRQRSAWLPWAGYSTTDRMLGNYPGIEGIKTGYTDPAGYCFTGAASRNGVEIFGVVLGADSPADRFSQMRRLLDWGFAHARKREVVSADTTLGACAVTGGWECTVTVHAEKPLSLTVSDACPPISVQASIPPAIKAPVHVGQQVGELSVVQNGAVLATMALTADSAVRMKPATPTPTVAVVRTGPERAPSLWERIAGVWAGLGRMLGV